MSRRVRDTSKKRQSIMEAATEAFIAEGYETCSMDRIAELAGASKRTVYNHFPSKEILFQAVVDKFIDDMMALKRIAFDPNRPVREQLLAFADAKLQITRNETWLGMMKVLAGVFITNPNWVKETIHRVESEDDAFHKWLHQANQHGVLRVPDTNLAAESFWSMIGGAFFWPSIFMGPMEKSQAEPLKEELVDMFLSHYQIDRPNL